jgi:hypothetical protein
VCFVIYTIDPLQKRSMELLTTSTQDAQRRQPLSARARTIYSYSICIKGINLSRTRSTSGRGSGSPLTRSFAGSKLLPDRFTSLSMPSPDCTLPSGMVARRRQGAGGDQPSTLSVDLILGSLVPRPPRSLLKQETTSKKEIFSHLQTSSNDFAMFPRRGSRALAV